MANTPIVLLKHRMTAEHRQEQLEWLCANMEPVAEHEEALWAEAPEYFQRVESDGTLTDKSDPISWWRGRHATLVTCYKIVRILLLFHPTSAAVERVFSLINNFVTSSQNRLDDDTLRLQTMLQYNSREAASERQTEPDPTKYLDVHKKTCEYWAILEGHHGDDLRRAPPGLTGEEYPIHALARAGSVAHQAAAR